MNRAPFLAFMFVWACSSTTVASTSDGGSAGLDGGACSAPGDTYPLAAYEENARTELSLRAALATLDETLDKVEGGKTASATELTALFSPSIKQAATPVFAAMAEELFPAYEEAQSGALTLVEPPPSKGGRFGAYPMSGRGLDYGEALSKGAYGAVMFQTASLLVADSITGKKVDGLVALFGAHPSFPRADTGVANPDAFSAKYTKRRDAGDPNKPGLYAMAKRSLSRARVLAETQGCSAEADVREFFSTWEKALFATVIFYAKDATAKLVSTPTTVELQSKALHALGEAWGFMVGFRETSARFRTIPDTKVAEFLSTLGCDKPSECTLYKYVTEPSTMVPKLAELVKAIAAFYAFTPEDVAKFQLVY